MIASRLTREVEIFENQRFVFTQFSSKSLLPTDRRVRYSHTININTHKIFLYLYFILLVVVFINFK